MDKDVYKDGFMKLGLAYAELYLEGTFTLDKFRSLSAPHTCLMTIYHILLGHKEILPIEEQPKNIKDMWWEECKPHTQGLNAEQCRDFVRAYAALYAMVVKLKAKV